MAYFDPLVVRNQFISLIGFIRTDAYITMSAFQIAMFFKTSEIRANTEGLDTGLNGVGGF